MKDLKSLLTKSLNEDYDDEVFDEVDKYTEKLSNLFHKFNKAEIESFISYLVQDLFFYYDNLKEPKEFFDQLCITVKENAADHEL